MSYLEFLVRWFNLPFVVAILVGAAVGITSRARRARSGVWPTALVAGGVVGLTWNGALHDLGVEGYAERFGLVLLVSCVAGAAIGYAAHRARRKLFPAVQGLAFTTAGLEGTDARIVSRGTNGTPASGRAQWRDEEGILHLVRVHSGSGPIPFGRPVRLVAYDAESRSYRVEEG